MKKVLMIAYYFPPAAGVGTFRIAKFVKYLPCFHWKPIVLTVKTSNYRKLDETLIADLPRDIEIYRTGIARLPMNEVGMRWLPILIKESKKIIEREKIDIVYFTGGPFFQWRASPIIKRKCKIPYVIDFRDPWVLSPYKNKSKGLKKNIGEFLSKRWEPLVIENTARVIFATKEMEELYSAKYPSYKQKFLTIENGYDPDDYRDISPKDFSTFSIVYTGKMSYYRNPKSFFEALRLVKDRINFQFFYVGEVELILEKLVTEKGLKDRVIFTGLKLYKEAISYSKGADILVLITRGSKIEFTQKVFDYISCNKPIIAIANRKSAVAKFLNNFENSFVIENDPQAIKDAIIKIYKNRLTNLGVKDRKKILKYHRKNLTQKLASVFNETIKSQ